MDLDPLPCDAIGFYFKTSPYRLRFLLMGWVRKVELYSEAPVNISTFQTECPPHI